jgi:hypothetical protein
MGWATWGDQIMRAQFGEARLVEAAAAPATRIDDIDEDDRQRASCLLERRYREAGAGSKNCRQRNARDSSTVLLKATGLNASHTHGTID